MAPEEITDILERQFGDAILDSDMECAHPHVRVAADRWLEIARFLREDARLNLNLLRSISAVDMLADNKLAAVYDLMTIDTSRGDGLLTETHAYAVRIETDRDDPHIPSVAGVWPAADWHEREAYDLMGIVFDGHPDPRRILCPDDWEGHPLRKDYDYPLEYHGIPGTTEYELPNPRH